MWALKSGFVAVAGRPNVGKSTLVNALAGGKVAIVSDKPQTTRRRIMGIANGDDFQLVLADLPGFQRPLDALTERMQRTVDRSLEDVEAVLLVLSARERIGAGDRYIAEKVFGLGVPVVIVLNKVDRLKPGHIAEQMQNAARLGAFHSLHPVSALTGDGIDELRDDLVELLPEGQAYYPRDERTDLTPEVQIAELVREKALQLTREEVPHALSVEVDEVTKGGASDNLRRDGLAEADRRRQGRLDREEDRDAGEAGDRAPARPSRVPRPEGEGEAEVAARRGNAGAPGHLMPLLVLFDVDGTLFLTHDLLAGQAMRETLARGS